MALPVLAVVVGWRGPGWARWYAVANAMLFAGIAVWRADDGGGARLDAGLWQRLHALTVYLPLAVIAWSQR